MKDNIEFVTFYILVLGLFAVLLCTENSILFSASISLICSFTGVFIGQLIKKNNKFHVTKSHLWILSGLFSLAIIISLCVYFLLDSNPNKMLYIILTNLALSLISIFYLCFLYKNYKKAIEE